MKKHRVSIAILLAALCSLPSCSLTKEINQGSGIPEKPQEYVFNKTAALSFSIDDVTGSYTKDNVSGDDYLVNYVFNEQNKDRIFKKPNDPLLKQGVHNKSLYMDGFSTNISIEDYEAPKNKITFSTWVAPRGFENLNRYGISIV